MPLPASVCTAGEVACMDICESFPQKCHLPAPTISVLYRYMLPFFRQCRNANIV